MTLQKHKKKMILHLKRVNKKKKHVTKVNDQQIGVGDMMWPLGYSTGLSAVADPVKRVTKRRQVINIWSGTMGIRLSN